MHLYYLIFLLCVCQAGEGTFLATFSALEVRVFKLYASAGRAELSPNMDYFSGGAGLLPLLIYVPIWVGLFWFFFKGCVAECMFLLKFMPARVHLLGKVVTKSAPEMVYLFGKSVCH